MTRLKYTLIDTDASWEEHLGHASVPIIGGYAEVDEANDTPGEYTSSLTVEALLLRGYEIVMAEGVAEDTTGEPLPSASPRRGRSARE